MKIKLSSWSPAQRDDRISAFTLIEVLIVVVIMGLIMGVGSVQFREFSRRQTVVSSKRQLLADVRAAQSDAISGRKPSACTGTLQGYGLEIITSSSPASYKIFARCTSGASSQDYDIKIAQLPAGIMVSTPAVNPVLFKPVAEGTNLTTGSSVTINITSSSTSASDTLEIKASGEIK